MLPHENYEHMNKLGRSSKCYLPQVAYGTYWLCCVIIGKCENSDEKKSVATSVLIKK